MMKIESTLSLAILFGLVVGCANPVTYIHIAPPKTQKTIDIETIPVNTGVNETWSKLLSNIMGSDFKIQSIDSKSHIISLKIFGNAKEYIDCGARVIETEGNITKIVNADEGYSYIVYRDNHRDTYKVSNMLKGKAIILVSGKDNSSTIRTKTDLEFISNENMTTAQGAKYARMDRYILNIKGNERKHFDHFGTFCQSTGKLEEALRKLF